MFWEVPNGCASTSYIALVPTSENDFIAEARLHMKMPNGKLLDFRTSAIVPSIEDKLSFQVENKKVVDLKYSTTSKESKGVVMRKQG